MDVLYLTVGAVVLISSTFSIFYKNTKKRDKPAWLMLFGTVAGIALILLAYI